MAYAMIYVFDFYACVTKILKNTTAQFREAKISLILKRIIATNRTCMVSNCCSVLQSDMQCSIDKLTRLAAKENNLDQ